MNIVREPFTGAWQRNVQVDTTSILTYPAVFRCISLISSDIGKMRMRLVWKDSNGIWQEVEANSPFWPVLRKPNRHQNRIQFYSSWVESKLIHGNTYALKDRDARGVVSTLYVLDPTRVTVLVAPNGDVYYELRSDYLSAVPDQTITVPAREIIHDRWNTIHHPLVGTSPIHAAGVPAAQGLKIQEQSTKFFASGANPGGVLTAPGFINEETAARLKDYWDTNYGSGGPNVGRVAVLGDGLKYEPMMMSATDAQLLEQLKWSAETVCSVFGVPPHKVGIGQPPTYTNIEALNAQYYADCLQIHIESIELCLDEGLELGRNSEGRILGTEFDLDDLLRMDSKTQMDVQQAGVRSGIFSPNEARYRFNLKPAEGGDSPYMQQQQFSLEALAERDANKPFAKPARPALPPPAAASDEGSADVPSAGTAADRDDTERAIRAIERQLEWHERSAA
jgi:HK97 family phage portal protein